MTTIIATRSRFINQAEVVARAIAARANRPRKHPTKVRRVLLAHHLLLGDTLMLTPLIAKLRARYPEAEICMTVPRAIAPLYSTHPYGVRALPWDPAARQRRAVLRIAVRPCIRRRRQPIRMAGGGDACALDHRLFGRPQRAQELAHRRVAPLSRRSRRVGRHGGHAARRAATFAVRARRLDGASREALSRAGRAVRRAARRRQHAAQAVARGPLGSTCGQARHARNRAGLVGRSRRGSDRRRLRSRPTVSLRSPDASTCRSCGTCSRMRGCWWRRTPASRTSGRVAGARTVTLFGPGSAVVTGAGRFLAQLPLSRGHGRPLPVSRPARAVPARNRMGAPLRAHARPVPEASLHAGDFARRRDRRRRRTRRRGAMTARPADRPDQSGADARRRRSLHRIHEPGAGRARMADARARPRATRTSGATSISAAWNDGRRAGRRRRRRRAGARRHRARSTARSPRRCWPGCARRGIVLGIAHQAIYDSSRPAYYGTRPIIVFGVSRHVVATLRANGVANVHAEPLFGIGEIHRLHSDATPVRGPLCEWDERKPFERASRRRPADVPGVRPRRRPTRSGRDSRWASFHALRVPSSSPRCSTSSRRSSTRSLT